LYSMFGDWRLALASYNAGEGTVMRAIKRQGTNNYWDLRLPRETEQYVPQFMAVLAISRNPGKYGFDDVERDDPMSFDEIAFKGPVDLRAIARLADCSVQDLKDLNPAVLRHAATGREGVTSLRVPQGKGEILMARIEEGAALPAVDLTLKHRVRRRETLQRIANKYHVSAKRLALANGIGRKRPLKRGTVLRIPASLDAPKPVILAADDPRGSTAYVPNRVRHVRRVTVDKPAKSQEDVQLAANERAADTAPKAKQRITITVKRGQTLSSIAARHDVTVKDIKRWNRMKSNRLRRGARLVIYVPNTAQIASSTDEGDAPKLERSKARSSKKRAYRAAANRATARVVVQRGDTLGEIAARNRVSVLALKRANGLSSSRIRAGQKLRLPTS
jgi:membrane-bound lytic murein transglycosylase D